MGLRVSNDVLDRIKGKRIISMKIDPANESTVTIADRQGNTERLRLPASLVHLLDWHDRYAQAA
jgi:hypothetical protein